MKTKPSLIERRPTEVLTGIALAGAIYGFLAERGVPNAVAAIVAVVIAFVPAMISGAVDRLRASS